MTSLTKTHGSAQRSRRRLASGVVLAVVAGLVSAGFMSAAAGAADSCANAAVRIQTGSTGLPDCRAYEMVTPPYKEGFPVLTFGGFTDGGIFAYQLRGSIAGDPHGSSNNLYHGVRSAAGWITTPLGPPATVYDTSVPNSTQGGALPVTAESPDLRWSLWRMSRRADEVPQYNYWVRGPDGAFAEIGDNGGGAARGWSDDFSHVVSSRVTAGTPEGTALVELVGTGNDGPPRPVSVFNNGNPTPGQTCLRDVSPDGRVIVWASGCFETALGQLWARLGGTTTVAVSESECTRSVTDDGGLCNGAAAADYVGSSADGSRVFFTTAQQLVNGDVDSTNDLYACDVPAGVPSPVGSANGCATLTQVSGAADDARVDNVVAISGDGSKVYFVAQGVLADNLGVEDFGARAGDGNLYLWQRDGAHPTGQTRFVARVGDARQPQMTPDGRYLVFTTASALVTTGAGADSDSSLDVYRYDALTHTIVRVSTSVAGGGGNGSFDVAIPGAAISADGSTVVFGSVEPLTPSDTNGVADVYSWRDGQVSLITSGGGGVLGITPSGRDIFFATQAPVLAADRDVITDIYDARVDGGFAPARTPSRCSGDQCQGPLGQPPSLPGPPGGILSGGALAEPVPTFTLRAVSAAQRRSLAATGKVSLTVATNAPGTVSARATATVGGRTVTVGSGQRALTAPGRAVVALTLSKRARAQLASRGRLTVRIAVNHSKVALDRAVTLRLVSAKARRSAKRASVRPSATNVVGGRS